MRRHWLRTLSLAVILGMVAVLLTAVSTVALFDPDLSAILECVVDHGDGTYTAYFGYENKEGYEFTIPIGDDNKFTPAPQDRGQPTTFLYPVPGHPAGRDGRTPWYPNAWFQVDFDGSNLVWTLHGRTATASSSSKKCAEILGSVAGAVWCGGEGIDGVTVWLYKDPECDGEPDGLLATTETAGGGLYSFASLKTGPQGSLTDICYVVMADSADVDLGDCTVPVVAKVGVLLTADAPDQEPVDLMYAVPVVEFVPEPGTVVLLGSGLMGLAGYATLRWRTRE